VFDISPFVIRKATRVRYRRVPFPVTAQDVTVGERGQMYEVDCNHQLSCMNGRSVRGSLYNESDVASNRVTRSAKNAYRMLSFNIDRGG